MHRDFLISLCTLFVMQEISGFDIFEYQKRKPLSSAQIVYASSSRNNRFSIVYDSPPNSNLFSVVYDSLPSSNRLFFVYDSLPGSNLFSVVYDSLPSCNRVFCCLRFAAEQQPIVLCLQFTAEQQLVFLCLQFTAGQQPVFLCLRFTAWQQSVVPLFTIHFRAAIGCSLGFQFSLFRPGTYTLTPYILLFNPVKSPAYSLCSSFAGDFRPKI